MTTGGVPCRCPVCSGKGYVPQGFYSVPTAEEEGTETCRSCGGRGEVLVESRAESLVGSPMDLTDYPA